MFCAKPIEFLSLKIDGGEEDSSWVSPENLIGYEIYLSFSRRCAVIY